MNTASAWTSAGLGVALALAGKVGARTLVQVATAAMAAGRPEVAERNLVQARASMTEMRPSAFSLGVEGLYWEQMAALAASRKLDRAPPLKRAEAALSQAVRMAPSEADEWRAALVRVRQNIGSGMKIGVTAGR